MELIQRVLSEKNFLRLKIIIQISLLLFSILIISEYYIGRLTIGSDHINQYVAAKQLSIGNGLTNLAVNFEDLSSPHKKTLNSWPPGMSIVASSLFLIFNDIRTIHNIITFSNLFIFIVLLFKLLKLVTCNKLSNLHFLLFFLFLSFNKSFVFLSHTTDLVCVNLFMLSSIILIKFFRNNRKIIYLLVVCFLLSLTLYFRYAYLPAILVLPAFFFWRIIFNKKKEWKEFIISILGIIVLGFPFFFHIIDINSQASFVANQASNSGTMGFYPENIKYASPFPFVAFFDIFPLLKLMGFKSDFGYDRGYEYPFFIQVLFYIASIIILLPLVWLGKSIKNEKSKSIFWLFGFIFSIGLLSLVYISSLIFPSQLSEYTWSWSMIPRYYSVLVLLLFISFIYLILHSHNKYLKNLLFAFFGFSFLFSLTLKTYNYTKNYTPFDFEKNTSITRKNNSLLNSYEASKIVKSKNDKNSVAVLDYNVIDSFYHIDGFLGINNVSTCNIDKIKKSGLKTSSEIEVFLITKKNISLDMKEIINTYNAEQFQLLNNNIHIYKLILSPNA